MENTKIVNKKGFRLRKSGKHWITYGAVAGMVVAGISLSSGTVLADEVATATSAVESPTTANETLVAEAVVPNTPVTEATIVNDTSTGLAATNLAEAVVPNTPVTEATIVNDTSTGLAATNLAEAAATPTEEQAAYSANAGTVTGEEPVKVDHTEILDAAKDAEQSGVTVVQDPTSVAPTLSNAQEVSTAVTSVANAESVKASELASVATAHSTAVSQWTDQKNSTVAFNDSLDKNHLAAVDAYNKFVDGLDADTAKVLAQYKDAIIKTSEKVQTATDGTTMEGYQAYIKSLADQKALNDKAIADYLVKKAEYEKQSTAASTVVVNNAKLSESVINHNNSLAASTAAANNSLLTSANTKNAQLSLSASTANSENNAYNKSVMEKYNLKWTGDWDTDNATVEAFNKKSAAAQSQFDEANAKAHDRNVALPAAANGYTPSGSSTLLNSVKLPNGYEVVATGDLTQGGSTLLIKGADGKPVDASKIVTDVSWTNQNLEGSGLRTFTPGDWSDNWGNVYNYTTGGASKFYVVTQLQWYKIANGATTLDGQKHDVYVQFHKDAQGLMDQYKNSEVAVWNSNSAINAVDGVAPYGVTPGDGIRATFSLDKPNNDDDDIIWAELIADLDGGQSVQDTATLKYLGIGGGFATDSVITNNVRSDENLGFTYGKGMNENALDGYNSSPDGTVLAVASGQFTYVVRNTPGGNSSLVARADFGGSSKVNMTIFYPKLTLKAPVDFLPITYDSVTYTPVKYTPQEVPTVVKEPVLNLVSITAPTDPSFKKIPQSPKVPTVHYNLTSLNYNTPVEKEVRNEDGVDINNQSVAKNSTNVFIFNPKPLPAGRPITTSIVSYDYIQGGLELDIAGMQKVNTAYDISFSSDRLLSIVANAEEITRTNANRGTQYDPTSFTVIYKTQNDGATYSNTFRMDVNGGATGNGYTSYSNKVTIHTPGGSNNPNDPKNPNGPGNHKIQPVKNNTNKFGENINNKTLLQSDINHYVGEWDLDQYINDKSSKSAIANGWGYIDNHQDDAHDPIVKDFKAVTSKGDLVEGLKLYALNSDKLSEAPLSVQNFIKASGIDVSGFGDFFLWAAEDSQAFYDKYVQTGTDIFFNLPMAVKEGYVGDYVNQTFQIDFGNGYYGNVVENDVPNLVPKKDVVVDGKSVNNQTIAYGQEFKYLLSGAVIPGNRGEDLWEYTYIDDYDQTGDKFLDTYKAVATTDITIEREITLSADAVYSEDITLEDGTVIKAGETIPKGTKILITEVISKGSDLTKYTTLTHNEEEGIITIAFKKDFLESIVNSSEFGSDVLLDMKRIAYGEFYNKYVNRVNGVDYISNTVKTETPKPVVPETPKPTPPTPAEPVASTLPQTGEAGSNAGLLAGLLMLISSFTLLFRGKREEE